MKRIIWTIFIAVFASSVWASSVYTFKSYDETKTITLTIDNGSIMVISPMGLGLYEVYDNDDSAYYFESDNHGIILLTRDTKKLVYRDSEKIVEAFFLFSVESNASKFINTCDHCDGSGVCMVCQGIGQYDEGICLACNGTCKCSYCHGKGKK